MKNRFILIFSIILLISIQTANSQQWNTLLGNTITGTEYLGGDGTSTVPLRLKTITNFPINFYTNNSANPTMSHLTNGDLDVTTSTCRYLINSYPILWHNGVIRNIYLGVGAGNVNNTHSNTFVGYNTGLNSGNSALLLRHGSRNTFVGHQAGMTNDMGEENTFVGDSCGYNTLGTGGDG